MLYSWTTPIRYVRGVGPAKTRELENAGIETVGDLLEHQPLHNIYPGSTSIRDLPSEGHVIVKAKIHKISRYGSGNSPIVEATLNDGIGTCKAIWWNQVYIIRYLSEGMTATFWGNCKHGVLQQPKFSTQRFNPDDVIGGQYGLRTNTIKATLKEVLPNTEIPDWAKCDPSRHAAFEGLHFPKTKAEHEDALERLKFDELFLMQLVLELQKKNRKTKTADKINWYNVDYINLMTLFPYRFTRDQDAAVIEITNDLQSGSPMSRLLHGEVGSGKTAVAFFAAMLAALNKKRTLILCPTTILAIQHYETLKRMGWNQADLCLSGNVSEAANFIVIGTHTILNRPALLKSASLVIIDEFHKFGVEQRAILQKNNTHVLLMSATPIPRTLAMSVFGDLDVSTIRELPIKRGTVITRWVMPEKREQMYEIIEKELAKGKQAYVVYPRIDEGEDIENAADGWDKILNRFPYSNPELLTGKNSIRDKRKIFQRFRDDPQNAAISKILVSTIIAEVGLDNPNASVMVIEGADRFGLAQLHQLRGRVCRSTDTAFCFLVAETANEKSIARLDVMEKCNDGFEIAEHDLRIRGPGEVFSTRQHGLPDLKFSSILDDYDLLVKAKLTASEYISKLDLPENNGLKEMLKIKYSNLYLGETA